MCDGHVLAQYFTSWVDLKEAANRTDRGFGALAAASGVYCLRARRAPVTNVAALVSEYQKSPIFTALRCLDSSSGVFFNNIGLGLGWEWGYSNHANERLARLEQIRTDEGGCLLCPILYVGCSKSLYRRLHELLWLRHTINHPLWALLHSGWEFDLGYALGDGRHLVEEARIKAAYRARHGGQLPALMAR